MNATPRFDQARALVDPLTFSGPAKAEASEAFRVITVAKFRRQPQEAATLLRIQARRVAPQSELPGELWRGLLRAADILASTKLS